MHKKIDGIILAIIAIAFVGCKTSHNSTIDVSSANEKTTFEADDMVSGSKESSTINGSSSLNIDFDFEKIEYDTSITDSTGEHPIKSKTTIKSKTKKDYNIEETFVKRDSTIQTNKVSFNEKESNTGHKESQTKANTSSGMDVVLFLGVFIVVYIILKKIFK